MIFAADHDAAAVAAYNHNISPDARVLDVLDPQFQATISLIGACDVLLGGFPCQGFSKAGPKNKDDGRNSLYTAMIDAMRALKPKVFVAENVDGLAQNYNGSILDQIVEDCETEGYSVEWRILDAAWFGAPQHRRRIVIVGIRQDLARLGHHFPWPPATHRWIARNGEKAAHIDYEWWADQLLDPVTIREALKHLPDSDSEHLPISARDAAVMNEVKEGQKLCNARHDATSVRTWSVPAAFGETSAREKNILETIVRNRRHKKYGNIPNGNPLSLEVLQVLVDEGLTAEELDLLVSRKFLKRVGEKWDVAGAMFASGLYKRPLLDSPSPTVLTVFSKARYFVHPELDRPFTVREVARLQTFPDSFEFAGAGVKPEDAYRLIGNAVPPVLAQLIGERVLVLMRDLALATAA